MRISILVNDEPLIFIKNPQDFEAAKNNLVADGFPESQIIVDPESLKSWAVNSVVTFAETARAKIASTSAGKLAEYRIKEAIALSPSDASEAELALISREAKARGTNRSGLLSSIDVQAKRFREIALLIGVLEAETKAAIKAIPSDATDIVSQVSELMLTSKQTGESALAQILSQSTEQ